MPEHDVHMGFDFVAAGKDGAEPNDIDVWLHWPVGVTAPAPEWSEQLERIADVLAVGLLGPEAIVAPGQVRRYSRTPPAPWRRVLIGAVGRAVARGDILVDAE